MNEMLLLDYIKDTGKKVYSDSDKILDLSCAGEWVMFSEQSGCLTYEERHMIPLLDIVAWVYSKTYLTD